MKKCIYIATATLFILFAACHKTDKQTTPSNTIEMAAPDGSLRLGKDVAQVLLRINQATGLGEAKKITAIEYPHTQMGYYAVVTYAKKDGALANMVFANFQLGLQAAQLIYHDATQGQRNTAEAASCYVYWCTDAGTCSACQVKVTDPFGTPTLLCSCTTCRLHQQKEECPKGQIENPI